MRRSVVLASLLASCHGFDTVTVEVVPYFGEATVYFLADNGGVLLERRTSLGRVEGPASPGGSVVVVEPSWEGTPPGVTWIHGVEPGDHLDLSEDFVFGSSPGDPTFIDIPEVPEGIDDLELVAECPGLQRSGERLQVAPSGRYEFAACPGPFDLYVLGRGDGLGLVAYAEGLVPDAGGVVSASLTFAPLDRFAVEIDGFEVDHAGFIHLDEAGTGTVYFGREVEAGEAAEVPWIAAAGGPGIISLGGAGLDGHAVRLEARIGADGPPERLALGELPVPILERTGRGLVRWRLAGHGEHDLIAVHLIASEPYVSFARWRIYLPPGSTELDRSRLPTELRAHWPDDLSPRVEVIDTDNRSGWDDVRGDSRRVAAGLLAADPGASLLRAVSSVPALRSRSRAAP